jgi:S-adenosylmethionine decarboxylase
MAIPDPPVLYSVDLGECEALAALEPEAIISTFVAALERAGANVVQTSSHAYPGAGLTSVLILRESHAVLHTWPETGTVNLDIFSCSTRLKSLEAVDELRRSLGARRVSVQEIRRDDGRRPGPLPPTRA